MRVLIASCVRQVPEVLAAALQSWKWQVTDAEIGFAFVDDNTDQASSDLLANAGHVLPREPKPDTATYAVTDQTHHWSLPTFYWLAQQKQRLIEYAKAERYDAVWFVDSDLICSPDTLSSLIGTRKDVVSGVFWTRWQPDQPPLPQVWLSHPYELQGQGMEAHEFLGKLANRHLVKVVGLGACTLIRAGVFDKVGYWPLIEGLPSEGMWQGEDRHFCVRAARNRVELWADAWPDIWHCYRPADRSQIGNMLEAVRKSAIEGPVMVVNGTVNPADLVDTYPGKVITYTTGGGVTEIFSDGRPRVGDLASFTLEPLEEPRVAGHTEHVRGRLGAVRMLPQLEKELTSMRAGDERIIRLRFPIWSEVPEYRGKERLVRVRLLHCKPFTEHPSLTEHPLSVPEQVAA